MGFIGIPDLSTSTIYYKMGIKSVCVDGSGVVLNEIGGITCRYFFGGIGIGVPL